MMTFKRVVWVLSLSLLPFLGSQVQAQSNKSKTKKTRKTQESPVIETICEIQILPKSKGNLTSRIADKNQTQEEPVFEEIDEMPAFEGDLMDYLAKNIRYPKKALDDGIQGRVVVGFIVERDGSISHIEITRGVDSYLDKEAIRVVKGMPKWKPGKHKDKIVRTRYLLPIFFRLK